MEGSATRNADRATGRPGRPAFAAFCWLVAACALILSGVLLAAAQAPASWGELLLLAVAAFVAEYFPIRFSPTAVISASSVPILFAAVEFGAGDAIVVALVGSLAIVARRPGLLVCLWNVGTRVLCATAAGLAATAVAPEGQNSAGRLMAAAAAAAVCEAALDSTLFAAGSSLRGGGRFAGHFRKAAEVDFGAAPLYAAIVAFLVLLYDHGATWSLALVFVPLFAGQRLYRLYRVQADTSSALRKAHVALERSERRFRLLADRSTDAIVLVTTAGALDYANPAGAELFADGLLASVALEDRDGLEAKLAEAAEGATAEAEFRVGARGEQRILEARIVPYDEADGLLLVTCRDVTARRHMDFELRQAQKMEAVGRLAGGVAHDFNNLLTVMTGYGEILTTSLEEGGPLHHAAVEIQRAAERGAALTRRLLAFSRKNVENPEPLELSAVVRDLQTFLRRLIQEDIEIATDMTDLPLPIVADRNLIEQVLINLATNARDAMPAGGTIRISTTRVDLVGLDGADLEEGSYAVLEVADDGIGMDDETRAQIFEPFFTTKEVGKGTGLGLAMIAELTERAGGGVQCDSAPGEGATFRVLLPLELPAKGELAPAVRAVA